ncbi:MAG: redoxin family protein, partial [Bacteroidota bacterium]
MRPSTIICLLFVALLSTSLSRLVAAPADEHKTLAIGTAAPDFSLKGIDGNTYTLASFKKARILVIIFSCNHCPTAQAYEDRIIRLTRDYSTKGVSVVAIMPNDPTSIN